jgi:LysM repeat protein
MENPTAPTKLCPTCGTRVNEDAPRCLVCGTAFKTASKDPGKAKQEPAIRGSRMPEVTLSIPIILLLFVIFLGVGGGLTYFVLGAMGTVAEATPEPTETLLPTATFTPTQGLPTSTLPPEPTKEPLSYSVKEGDNCGAIAYAFDVSVQSIILLNGLSAECYLTVGTVLLIPHPTRTPTPVASNTPSDAQATIDACEKEYYTVQEGDDLSTIAFYREVPAEYIMEWSGKTTMTVFWRGNRHTIPCPSLPST